MLKFVSKLHSEILKFLWQFHVIFSSCQFALFLQCYYHFLGPLCSVPEFIPVIFLYRQKLLHIFQRTNYETQNVKPKSIVFTYIFISYLWTVSLKHYPKMCLSESKIHCPQTQCSNHRGLRCRRHSFHRNSYLCSSLSDWWSLFFIKKYMLLIFNHICYTYPWLCPLHCRSRLWCINTIHFSIPDIFVNHTYRFWLMVPPPL